MGWGETGRNKDISLLLEKLKEWNNFKMKHMPLNVLKIESSIHYHIRQSMDSDNYPKSRESVRKFL